MAKDKKNLDLENFDFEKFKKNALSDLKSGGSISGKDSVFKPLIKAFLERALEAELDEHLGYPKNAKSNNENHRNGYSEKTIRTGDN